MARGGEALTPLLFGLLRYPDAAVMTSRSISAPVYAVRPALISTTVALLAYLLIDLLLKDPIGLRPPLPSSRSP